VRNVSSAILLAALVVGVTGCGSSGSGSGGSRASPSSPTTPATSSPVQSGAEVFASANCGACHTYAAAGSQGQVGPNLDRIRATAAEITATIESGDGPMPPFAGKLTPAQIAAVTRFVQAGK